MNQARSCFKHINTHILLDSWHLHLCTCNTNRHRIFFLLYSPLINFLWKISAIKYFLGALTLLENSTCQVDVWIETVVSSVKTHPPSTMKLCQITGKIWGFCALAIIACRIKVLPTGEFCTLSRGRFWMSWLCSFPLHQSCS